MESSSKLARVRRTKIVCTIGPASESRETIEKLTEAGMDVARLNMSFGTHEYHKKLIERIRKASEKSAKPVAVLMDLSGAKVRIGRLRTPLTLHRGDRIKLTSGSDDDGASIPINRPEILSILKKGDTVHLADGSIRLKILNAGEKEATAEVIEGGYLTSYKGMTLPEKISLPPITEKDIEDLKFGVRVGIDWVAMSFVRSAKDIMMLKDVIAEIGGDIPIIAKIERREAVENLEEIIKTADGIMVARGDLGVEMPVEEIPIIQKKAIKLANRAGKPVITATQMLKSMVVQTSPTRAEVTDVANAVLDGSDALMLSEETASGNHPVEAVRVMDRIIRKAESIYSYIRNHPADSVTQSIAASAARMAEDVGAMAIITFTRTGSSAIQISRYRPRAPIIAATHSREVLRRLSIVWGCLPLTTISSLKPADELLERIVRECIERRYLEETSTIVVTSGVPFGRPGTTNTIRILRAGDVVHP
ncbi:pyruvate kinase [Geoglobus sp.]